MIKPNKTPDEAQRLKDLESFDLLDTLPEKEYDEITKIASQICGAPISLISLIDEKRQWFKSHHGIEATETPREYAFCAHAIHDQDSMLIVPDSRKDDRFHDNPLVTDDPNVIFYAGVPLISPKGHALGTLCVIDNSPRQLTERQQESLRALASHVVKLFELRKSRSELRIYSKELELRNSELRTFAMVAAHDIKSPLASMSSLLSLLETDYKDVIDESGQRLLHLLTNSAEQLRELVDGILSHSQSDKVLSEGTTTVQLSTFFMKLIKLIDPERKHHFIVPIQSESILVNKIALQQILINLITNAIKYNDKPKILIQIDFWKTSSHYHFTVKDNGLGIKESYINKVFEIFEVGHMADREGKRGSGVGLATVKKLVQGLGGQVTCTSEVGIGSVFTFSIAR